MGTLSLREYKNWTYSVSIYQFATKCCYSWAADAWSLAKWEKKIKIFFLLLLQRVLYIYRSVAYPHLFNSLSDSWKFSKLHKNTSFRFCHYRDLERPNPENRAEVYTKRISQMGGLYMMADSTKQSDCSEKAE